MVSRDARVTRVSLVEPDVYKPHNVERHLFPLSAAGRPKADLAREWLKERRPDLEVRTLACEVTDPLRQPQLHALAADNEPAKYHFDALMRQSSRGSRHLAESSWRRPSGPTASVWRAPRTA